MRKIVTPKGEVYCGVEVREGKLKFYLKNGAVVILDAQIIPQLKDILAEAEFFKSI